MSDVVDSPIFDVEQLRTATDEEYALVANDPGRGFHFHTWRPLAKILGCPHK